MFVRALLLLLPVTLLVTGRLLADDDSSRAGKIDSLYSSLNAVFTPTDMGDPMMAEDSMLIKSFPENDQANVLAEIVERAAKTQKDVLVLGNALHLAQFNLPDGKRRWNKKLESVLLSLSDNTNPGIREYLVSIFLTHPDADHREVIIPLIYSLLGQEDDQMREGILDDVIKSKWPETKQICEDYVRTTQATEKYKESILVAKAYLNPADSDRAEVVLNKQNTPHAFEYYKSYIEAHKNDPNYAVSVNTALQAYNSIQGEVVFYKSQHEYKDSQDAVKNNSAVVAKYGRVTSLQIDDWGNNRAINGVITYGEYGTYQFKLQGTAGNSVVRVAWHYKDYRFDVTKIDEIAPDGTATALWASK